MLSLVRNWIGAGRIAMRKPRTFDYTKPKRHWGHDLSGYSPSDGGLKARVSGWGPEPEGGDELKREWMEVGDYLILSHPGGQETARYRIEKIQYMSDPPDQWFADLSFAPRDHGSIGTKQAEGS